MNVAVARVTETGLPLIYVNQVGGQDELVFDGARSCSTPITGSRCSFRPGTRRSRSRNGAAAITAGGARRARSRPLPRAMRAAYHACVLGLRDYVDKNRFPGVVLGLSGGVDSALVAALAVDALGPDRVHGIMLPYRYTSHESIEDATACAAYLGIRFDTVPIEAAVSGVDTSLAKLFAGKAPDITEENIQSRIRGVIMMAISNKFGAMVLTTGNKSEMSVGYATLYGDMNGGFNPVKDLYKMEVYRLSRWRNAHVPAGSLGPEGAVIPINILTKAPTAELRENQKDEDSLPPYSLLDDILMQLVEYEASVADIVKRGPRSRGGEEGRAAALSGGIQAPAGGAGRQDLVEELRPRPALPDHEQVQGRRLRLRLL